MFRADAHGVRLLTIIVYSGLAMIAFVYLTPPEISSARLRGLPFLGSLAGDLPGYVVRFALSFFLFGVGSLVIGRLFGLRPGDLGLRRPGSMMRSKIYWLLFLLVVASSFYGAYQPPLRAFYPYSHTLLSLAVNGSPWLLLVHAVSYFFFYYIPWELFFRGLLILPFLPAAAELEAGISPDSERAPDGTSGNRTGKAGPIGGYVLAIAAMQTLPSTLVHFGHPVSEVLSALLFGLITAVLVVRSRSIVPGLLIHATAGIVLDLAIAARAAGVLA